MIALLFVFVAQGNPAELASRAVREDDPEKRAALVGQLRKFDVAAVEKTLRSPSRGPSPFELGSIQERSSRSDLDGEEFKYAIQVPAAYDPAKAWPLLITLHGAGGNGLDWIRTWARTAGTNYVLVAPTTPRHTWAARQGYSTVLTALRETADALHIDPDRVFLDGMSMGAGGAFRLAEHFPDRWAAIGPRCNVPDIRQKKDKTYVTMLAENYRMVPVYWVLGAKDEKIPIEMGRAAKAELEAAKGELVYREFAEGGHDWSLEKDESVLDWYNRHVRTTYPEELVWKSYEKIFARAWWVEVTKRTEPPPLTIVHLDQKGAESERRTELRPPALVRARRKGNAIEISTEEVRELRVYLDDAMVELDKPVAIMVNGRKLHDATVKRSMDVLIDDAHRRRDPSMLYSAFVDLKVPALK
ncbi:MAG TPA: PHB depolymerase family esterase [Planctomycetota bacterium]|nr:PHB depolymerase family esterase [Planctomycetota bacterium]